MMTFQQIATMERLPAQDSFILERTSSGPRFNFPHAVVFHSPTGMEYGYGGSGPADTALNILIHFVNGRTAWRLHQSFKFDLIARLNSHQRHVLTSDTIRQWIQQHPAPGADDA